MVESDIVDGVIAPGSPVAMADAALAVIDPGRKVWGGNGNGAAVAGRCHGRHVGNSKGGSWA